MTAVNYRHELKAGASLWCNGRYEEASLHLLQGLSAILQPSPHEFLAAGVLPGRNLLGCFCDGVNEGSALFERHAGVVSSAFFPRRSYHLGWLPVLLEVLHTITTSNLVVGQNADGYLHMARLEAMYAAGLRPTARRTLLRLTTAPIWEYVIGHSLGVDTSVGGTVVEHTLSPLAADILGSLHSGSCPDDARQKMRRWDRYLAINDSIDAIHRQVDADPELREAVGGALLNSDLEKELRLTAIPELNFDDLDAFESLTAETFFSPGVERFKRYLIMDLNPESALTWSQFLHNYLPLSESGSQSIVGQPQMEEGRLREVLRPGEVLVISATYETSYLFVVVSPDRANRVYTIESSTWTDRSQLGPSTDPDLIDDMKLVLALYAGPAGRAAPVLQVIKYPQPYRAPSPNIEVDLAIGALAELLDAPQPIGARSDTEPTLGEAIDHAATVFWALVFPLAAAPMQAALRCRGHERIRNSFVPSGTVLSGLRRLHAAASSRTHRALVYSDPSRNLQCSKAECELVCARLAALGFEVDLHEGAEADRAFLIDHLRDYDVFHFSGHGHEQAGAPMTRMLQLARDPLLVEDLLTSAPRLRFAFLNTCHAGEQQAAPYGELTGPANVFLAAGTAAVIAPLVPVYDETAASLADTFYTQLTAETHLGDAAWRAIASLAQAEALTYRFYGLPDETLG